ncbi:MAG: hypothetical protein Q4C98_11345, partial [Capnocytophaga sp.]|nr:hypothetical protein [Capnocytophaga sp.]
MIIKHFNRKFLSPYTTITQSTQTQQREVYANNKSRPIWKIDCRENKQKSKNQKNSNTFPQRQ